MGERFDQNVSLAARDSRHWEVLAAHAAELSPMSLTTAECVANVVMGADKAGKHDLANTIDRLDK